MRLLTCRKELRTGSNGNGSSSDIGDSPWGGQSWARENSTAFSFWFRVGRNDGDDSEKDHLQGNRVPYSLYRIFQLIGQMLDNCSAPLDRSQSTETSDRWLQERYDYKTARRFLPSISFCWLCWVCLSFFEL